MSRIVRCQPASVAQSVMGTEAVVRPAPKRVQMPESLVDISRTSRIQALRPDLDYKQAEYVRDITCGISVFVQKIIAMLQVDDELRLELPSSLARITAPQLSEYLLAYAQVQLDSFQIHNPDAQVGAEHIEVFRNSILKHVMGLRLPRMNTFERKKLQEAREVSISRNKLILLLEEESKLQKMTTVAPKVSLSPQPALVISQQRMDAMCQKLYSDYLRINQKNTERQRMKYEEELKHCTFKPQVSERARAFQTDPTYGGELYKQKQQAYFKKEMEDRIIRHLNHLIQEAEGYGIRLDEGYLAQVKQDLEQTRFPEVQKQIINQQVERIKEKYQELERQSFAVRQSTGQIQKVKLSFHTDDTVFQPQLASQLDASQAEALQKSALIQKQKQDDAQRKWEASDRKSRRASLRAQILRDSRQGAGTYKFDLQEIEKKYGWEGVEIALDRTGMDLPEGAVAGPEGPITLFSQAE